MSASISPQFEYNVERRGMGDYIPVCVSNDVKYETVIVRVQQVNVKVNRDNSNSKTCMLPPTLSSSSTRSARASLAASLLKVHIVSSASAAGIFGYQTSPSSSVFDDCEIWQDCIVGIII
jgi:hypothetical protein